jgi:D-alanine transaminase
MSRIAYVNGQYLPHASAAVHVEDRGYQFADGLYEVVAVYNGNPVDFQAHYQRLCDGMQALAIIPPMRRAAMVLVLKQMIRRNRLRNGMLYFQVTRGVASRNHPFPKNTPPSFVVTARPSHGPSSKAEAEGVKAISAPDLRWARRDIKSIALLPNVLAKQKAAEAGALEAILVSDAGVVSEGSASNMWMVDGNGQIITHPLSTDILPGTVRQRLIELARGAGYAVIERSFTLTEALSAREVFLSSSTNYALSVVQIDDLVIANGDPGSVASELRFLYKEFMAAINPLTAWDE